MRKIAVWHVAPTGPQKLESSNINLEKELEEWIEKDPNLLEKDLIIINKQMNLEAGRLDLLAMDNQGNFVVIELKRGMVNRDTVAQAIDYGACIRQMPFEDLANAIDDYLGRQHSQKTLKKLLEERSVETIASDQVRPIRLFVVGTGQESGLERMLGFLSNYQVPISIVRYEVFEVGNREKVLIRELTEEELAPVSPQKPNEDLETLCALADEKGIGKLFRSLRTAAEKHGLYPRPYRISVMYTPPNNHSHMLFTVSTKSNRNGTIRAYIGPQVFSEFYSVSEKFAEQCLGQSGWREMTSEDISKFVTGLDKLFASIRNGQSEE